VRRCAVRGGAGFGRWTGGVCGDDGASELARPPRNEAREAELSECPACGEGGACAGRGLGRGRVSFEPRVAQGRLTSLNPPPDRLRSYCARLRYYCVRGVLHRRCACVIVTWPPVASKAAGSGTVVLHISHAHTKIL
jgi:hypothetical protein